MKDQVEAKRRNVLKTLGAGVVGGTVLTGTATAGSGDNPDETIVLDNFSFVPRRASVALDSDGTAVVRWEHKHKINGKSVPHDVHIFDSKGGDRLVRSSDDDIDDNDNSTTNGGDGDPSEDLQDGEKYDVKFRKEDGKLVLDEVRDDSRQEEADETDDTGVSVDFTSGSVTLYVHCSHHDPGMSGKLTIKE